MFTILVSYSPSLDVNYAFVTERAYSHSGRHEMNLDDEGFTEMSDCVWEKLRMGGGLKECSVLCLITPLCVTRIHTLRLLSPQPQHVVRHSVQIYVCHRGVFAVWAAECRCVRIYCFAFRDWKSHDYVFSSRCMSPQWQVSDRKQSQDCSCICSLAKLHVA